LHWSSPLAISGKAAAHVLMAMAKDLVRGCAVLGIKIVNQTYPTMDN
jgi:uncharacterized membrane protein YeiB